MVVKHENWLRFAIPGFNLLPKVINEDFELLSISAFAYFKIRVPISEAS